MSPSERVLRGALPLTTLAFGAPLALGMGLQTVFNLVDAYLIGRLQPEVAGPALGAIGVCDQLAALGSIVSYGLSTATAVIVSRALGEGDTVRARRVAFQSLYAIGGLSIAFALVGLFGARSLLVGVMGVKGEVATLSIPYLRVMFAGSASIFFLLHLTTLLRAAGSAKTPASLLVLANVLNLILAAALIYGPGPAPPAFGWASALGLPRWELQGAAWGTVFARLAALLPLIVIVVRRFRLMEVPSAPDAAALREIVALGWPSSAQLVVRIAAMLLTHSLVARAFTTDTDQSATTALGVVFRIETMALFVGLGWGSAAQTFMGQCLGAGVTTRAQRSGWLLALWDALSMLVLFVFIAAQGEALVRFFDASPTVVAHATSYFAVVAPSWVALGVAIVLGAAMQGAGATRLTLLLDSAVVALLQLPLSLVAVLVVQTPRALWWAVALTYVGFALVTAGAYRKRRHLRASEAASTAS